MDSGCYVMWVMTVLAVGTAPSGIVIKHTELRSWTTLESWNLVSHVGSIGDYLDNLLMWHCELGKISVRCVFPIAVDCFGYQLESHGRHFLNEHMILCSG